MSQNQQSDTASRSTIDAEEVAKFTAMAAEWWDPHGKFRPLHKFNPVRLAYIREQVCARFDRDPKAEKPFTGLRFLDIGCGGGLLSEPMARLGADIVGADASPANIQTASLHAKAGGLDIDYRATTAEALAASGEQFDVILNMEVIEHVADPQGFLTSCASMLKPGGCMFLATLNRTLKSFALAIVGAEYVLGWLPRGTHDWHKFITPTELDNMVIEAGLTVHQSTGVSFNPLLNSWAKSGDMSVNYMAIAEKRS
ncbi:bifunctional 2-polyprenyl-6-hydroxyphenol methylase/3-demethylubiquinol 3-O-methyltransferase UbiG [Alphaproteobacteria bacterium]|nr:bifunctional 2-polyprenyl-6-hydroxyphenol methylase/3-demethylubiquinol 3-O-methyltransferase UbiG [Alphaproteobacteria bacterium]MDC1241098.1 bifunctional 2-polyprenyl-6-hydroxyphenol methylase/3-demethylubiquinol 3-O-methyltransferase UbiG [bacterium]